MIALSVVQPVLVVYALLLLIGGFIGFAKAGSRASLIAGIVSGLAALVAVYLTTQDPRLGLATGAVVALLLAGFFGYRFLRKTRKFMPAGLLSVVSILVLVIVALGLV
jgi:uncharacterized membrane protein (UPF0136 family)